jgi:uncharacterized protein YndB with AHSA1/START domain
MGIKETHKRSVHIDAPVEKVFEYVKHPKHFLEAFPDEDRRHMALAEVDLAPDGGLGSTYRLMGRMFLLFHLEWTFTREEYVPNERFMDHTRFGGAWTFAVAPDETGTTLSAGFGWTDTVPLVPELAVLGWDGDRDLDAMLANLKQQIEG